MIKCDFGKGTHISGHPVQIAAELEELMREVRNAMCELLGKENGMSMYAKIILYAQMTEEQRKKYAEDIVKRAHAENPKLVKEASDYADALMEMLFGETVRPGSVEEED